MDRRAFLGSMLKVAAATALPSEIWPFRKIFLPAPQPVYTNPIIYGQLEHLAHPLFAVQENFDCIIDPTLLPLRQGIRMVRWEGVLLRAQT